ncbi:hypothetical protein LTR37_019563 [Vermiconidia calcicola]|uniref:Uncharacterized protein n=1 Tax=Vermiconidia calcicola TaxID=1690605 RepID=A0ACC3MDU4_9PEZI|nr:hypothetical protein LTR37_019563 [Vermiconidia calcicola]
MAASKASSRASSVAGDNGRAGLSLTKSGVNNPNPIQHATMGQAERAFSAGSTFLTGIMAISASQFIGAPLKLVDPTFYEHYMAWTKESFAVLTTTITQWWSPTVVRVSGDESMEGQLYQMEDGTLKCNFPHRLVLMANHQLYTDWMYLWWIAYTNKMHGHIYIILKESLKKVPIFGWGAQFYNFIFLSRKWETDRFRFRNALSHLKNPKNPMWLLIFPEGTNLSAVTREKSAKWAKKVGVPDMKHQLLPRSTGLQFCLQELRQTTNWLYDCTIAYEGVPRGQYGQDIFTLRSSLFEDIPLDNDEAFGRWLSNRWREKDYILEYYATFQQFPADDAIKALAATEGKREPNHAKAIGTEVKGGGWDEFLSIFGPITTAAGALSNLDMTDSLNFDAIMMQVAKQQQLSLSDLSSLSNLTGNLTAPVGAASQQMVRNALRAAQKSGTLPPPVMEYLMKETPQTQEQMKNAIMKYAAKSGNPNLAKKAAQAPGEKQAVPVRSQQDIAKVAQQTQQVISEVKKKPQVASPAPNIKQAMPMAKMESVVTRPLSTMAMQGGAAAVRKVAAQRTQQKGAALSGQATAAKKATAPAITVKNPPAGSKAQSVGGAQTAKKSPSKTSTADGARRQSVASLSTTKKAPQGSKAIGTQKYPVSTKG